MTPSISGTIFETVPFNRVAFSVSRDSCVWLLCNLFRLAKIQGVAKLAMNAMRQNMTWYYCLRVCGFI